MITAAALAAGTYAIDPARSRVRFTATHAFGLGPVYGSFTIRDGAITIAADPADSSVTARLAADSFTTDKTRRDADIRSKRFLHAQAYPDILFVSDRLSHDDGRWLLHGRLTVRGTTAPVTLELAAGGTGTACRFRATARIDRYAHRVGPRGILGRYVLVEFDIFGTPG
jgi:polyisoprenoid-binding protein YceI